MTTEGLMMLIANLVSFFFKYFTQSCTMQRLLPENNWQVFLACNVKFDLRYALTY